MRRYSLLTKLMLAAAVYFLVALATMFLWAGLKYGMLIPFVIWVAFLVFAMRIVREHRR